MPLHFAHILPLLCCVAPATYVSCSKDTLLALPIVVIVDLAQAAAKSNQHVLLNSPDS